ncbi:hypothetical protein [Qipengyuania spongiae]|uniref:Uncharacterized protein n=1 Tax=Qipengyuania spongiae TaxID=2909673 RepID=A0ABY5SZB6_9SPHN|nr:hypothetical protein [Qipengyuania spongiae]UVI39599.1 hypothetical protein L1F33_01130 [Qipengyuania spongiae]
MFSHFLASALVLSAAAQPAPLASGATGADLPIEQQTALRCATAIAIATERQRTGTAGNEDWPDLLENQRGREFFVRSFARLIDDTGLSREELALRGRAEAEALAADNAMLDAVMPPCLLMMRASGL